MSNFITMWLVDLSYLLALLSFGESVYIGVQAKKFDVRFFGFFVFLIFGLLLIADVLMLPTIGLYINIIVIIVGLFTLYSIAPKVSEGNHTQQIKHQTK